jgi:hypothetical protein
VQLSFALATQLQESRRLRKLEMVRAFIALALLPLLSSGCGKQAPNIRMLEYSPNAGFQGMNTEIDGTFLYSDAAQDISQYVYEVSDPDENLVTRSAPIPGMDLNQGITGMGSFSLTFNPSLTGLYHFSVWVVDLTARESNHLVGEVRIATTSPYGPDNP